MKRILLYSLVFFKIFSLSSSASIDTKDFRIAIVSLYDQNYKHIGQHSDENKRKYAKKHGYDVFIYHNILDTKRPAAWSKILAIQKHLSDYDWIYWSDADSLIMNTDMRLENFIDDKIDLIISKGCYDGNLNTGSFLLKNSPWSHALLKKIYAQEGFINNSLWEQAALQHLMKQYPVFLKHLKILPHRSLNANFGYGNPDYWYKPGDFIIHFYGHCDKAHLMETWSKKVAY